MDSNIGRKEKLIEKITMTTDLHRQLFFYQQLMPELIQNKKLLNVHA